jgi:outer membrane protein
MLKKTILAVAAVLAFSSVALAEEQTLTLKEAVNIALRENPEIRAFNESVSAGEEDIGSARSYLFPKVTVEERFMRTTNPTFAFMSKLNQERFAASDFAINSLNNPSPVNDFQTSFSIEQPIFVQKVFVGLDMAKKEHTAKEEDFSRKREEVAFETVKTYLMAITASEFVKVAEKGVEDATEHKRIAELMYDSKLGLYSDVLRASTGLTEAEERRVSAKKNYTVVKRALGLLLGMSGGDVEPKGDLPEFPLKDLDYYTNASASRKDVRSLETRYENAKRNVDLARADWLPMLGVGASYQLNDHSTPFGGEGNSWTVQAFLRWNILDWALRGYESSKAKHTAAQTLEYLNGLKKSVSFRIYEAYLGVEEARKNMELAGAAEMTAEEGERLVRSRYENSLSPIVDLLDAQVSLDNARANDVMKKNDYRVSIANLGFQSGTILKDLGLE